MSSSRYMTTTLYTITALGGNKLSIKRKRPANNEETAESSDAKAIGNLLQECNISASSQFFELIRNDAGTAKLYNDTLHEMRANDLLKNITFTMLVNAKVNLGDAADYIINFGLKNQLTEYHYIFILAQLKLAEEHSTSRQAFHVTLDNVLYTAPQIGNMNPNADKIRRLSLLALISHRAWQAD